MSYYEPQAWQAPARQQPWEQPPPPSRSGLPGAPLQPEMSSENTGASSTSSREENNAFASQFEEVDRVIDNLVKSGKYYTPGARRDIPMPMGGPRPFADHNPRMHGNRHSIGSDFDPARSHSASNLQSFYASQRYQGRQSEAEQMQQAKRRMAAQRERELRNYHQEQQYNRSVMAEMSSNKSDRSMSPSTLSEEGRRELIARQHRALYGNEAPPFHPQAGFGDDGGVSRDSASGQPTSAGGMRGNSPRGVDPFGMGGQVGQGESGSQIAAPAADSSRNEKSGSPTAGTGSTGKAPTPPAGEEGHSRQVSKSTTAPAGGMGPIGSRPAAQQAPNPGLNKRSTTPLYGFGGSEQSSNERAGSSNSNSNSNQKDSATGSGMGAWGTGSGVWGSNKIGATSVWG